MNRSISSLLFDILAFATCSAATSIAGAVTITFDELAINEVVDTQHPEVTFSSTPGFETRVLGDAAFFGTSAPNHIHSAIVGGSATGTDETILTFTKPVNTLQFWTTAVNAQGAYGSIDIDHGGGSATLELIGDGVASTPDLIDLSNYFEVTRVRLYALNDAGGSGWDDFSFTPVPEPPTGLLAVVASISFLGLKLRQRVRWASAADC